MLGAFVSFSLPTCLSHCLCVHVCICVCFILSVFVCFPPLFFLFLGDLLQVKLSSKLFTDSGPKSKKLAQGIQCIRMTKDGNILIGTGDGVVCWIAKNGLTIIKYVPVFFCVFGCCGSDDHDEEDGGEWKRFDWDGRWCCMHIAKNGFNFMTMTYCDFFLFLCSLSASRPSSFSRLFVLTSAAQRVCLSLRRFASASFFLFLDIFFPSSL